MEIDQIKAEAQSLLKEKGVSETLKYLNAHRDTFPYHDQNMLILLSGRLARLKNLAEEELLTEEQMRVTRNRLKKSLRETINKMPTPQEETEYNYNYLDLDQGSPLKSNTPPNSSEAEKEELVRQTILFIIAFCLFLLIRYYFL